eukprot:m.65180 g.65180  ORF g.65180 m.65180 type:complete len:651 (+) comp7311_c0_seq1:1-1953(+)
MGLGKTLQTITLLWTLLKQGPYSGKPVVKRVLIVCPGSLVKNWEKEFNKWLGTQRINVYAIHGDAKIAEIGSSSVYPVMIVSYEMMLRNLDAIQAIAFDMLVCDEAHRLKNSSTKTCSAIASLSARRRIALTGTPIQNDLQEFFAIVEFCRPGILGNLSTFRRVYEEPIVQSRQPQATADQKTLGRGRAAELNRIVQMFCLRRTEEVNNKYLPDKHEYIMFCPPTTLQRELYVRVLGSDMVQLCLSATGGGAPHLICISALKKLCNSPTLLTTRAASAAPDEEDSSMFASVVQLVPQFSDVMDARISSKLNVVVQILQRIKSTTTERVLVVSNSTKCLDMLDAVCQKLAFKTVRLEGSTPVAKRIAIVDKFNAKHSDDFVFLLSSKAGGVGLNITGASRLVMFDIDWNPATDIQAMARIWRDGQKRPVHIYRLLTTGTIEEKIFQRQVSKQGISGAVVDDRAASGAEFSIEDLRDLFTFRDDTMCDTHTLLGCNCHCPDGSALIEPERPTKGRGQKKTIAMDQLMHWKHLPTRGPGSEAPVLEDDLVAHLRGRDLISFLFYSFTPTSNRSDAGPVEENAFDVERASPEGAEEAVDPGDPDNMGDLDSMVELGADGPAINHDDDDGDAKPARLAKRKAPVADVDFDEEDFM